MVWRPTLPVAVLVSFAALPAVVDAHMVEGSSKPQNSEECKTICQRFGMKTLGPDYGSDPGTCSQHCDVVFKQSSSLLMLEGSSKPQNSEECKTICQRFGMKALGPDYGSDPGTCSQRCDVVFKKSSSFLMLASSSKPQNSEECKTICQRFGMKSLGPDYGSDPGTCSQHCDDVFKQQQGSSLVNTASNGDDVAYATVHQAKTVRQHNLRSSGKRCRETGRVE